MATAAKAMKKNACREKSYRATKKSPPEKPTRRASTVLKLAWTRLNLSAEMVEGEMSAEMRGRGFLPLSQPFPMLANAEAAKAGEAALC